MHLRACVPRPWLVDLAENWPARSATPCVRVAVRGTERALHHTIFCCCQLKTIISCDEDWFLLIPNLCASVCLESVCLYAVHTLNTALACVVLCSQRLTRTFAVFRFAHKKRKRKKKRIVQIVFSSTSFKCNHGYIHAC